METRTPTADATPGKSTAAKLLIKPVTSLWISDDSLRPALDPLPEGVATASSPVQATTVILVARDAASLRSHLARLRADLERPSVLWVAYPKTHRIDLHRDSVWPILVEHGCRPVGHAAIGDDWSAMRFRPLAPGEAKFTGGR